jgi:hypothetical protein
MSSIVIYFRQGKKDPINGQLDKLKPLISVLANPGTSITISGHASTEGSEQLNRQLAQQRARTLQSYLVSKGAQTRQLKVEAYGADHPAVQERGRGTELENQRSKNRRVEVEFEAGDRRDSYAALNQNLRKRYQQAVDILRKRLQKLKQHERNTLANPKKVPVVLRMWQEEVDATAGELKDYEGYLADLDTLEKLTSDPKKVWDVASQGQSVCDSRIRLMRELIEDTKKRLTEAQRQLGQAKDSQEKDFWKELAQDYQDALKERQTELGWLYKDKAEYAKQSKS